MGREQAVRQLKKRLIVLMAGLALSYAISFGLAIFLVIDAEIFASEWGGTVVVGLGVLAVVLAFIHVRAQFRRFDYLVRMVEASDDD
ncbi:MAG: hypothetical protein O7G13_07725 [Alphaproteobacteria bacterium]|nr:hypothetical protein [Alphaproteobacteria bacterium]